MLGDGAEPQVVFQIAAPSSPTSYEFGVDGADDLVATGTGEVVLYRDERQVGYLRAPWAVDGAGVSVPTHFEIKGSRVVQVCR